MRSTAPNVEGCDKHPGEWTHPCDDEERKHREWTRCEVGVGGERGEADRQVGADDAGTRTTRPKKRKLCRVTMARSTSTRSITFSLGQTYAPKQSSHGT